MLGIFERFVNMLLTGRDEENPFLSSHRARKTAESMALVPASKKYIGFVLLSDVWPARPDRRKLRVTRIK